MRYNVFRSLDRPASFLGIKGKFFIIIAASAGVFGFVGIVLGVMFQSGVVGFSTFFGGIAIGTMITLTLQDRMSVRQLTRFLSSRKCPDFIQVQPVKLVDKADCII